MRKGCRLYMSGLLHTHISPMVRCVLGLIDAFVQQLADLLSPDGAVLLHLERAAQVEVLGVVCGLSTRVADVALHVQPLRDLHGVVRPHT